VRTPFEAVPVPPDSLAWELDGVCRQVDVGDVFYPEAGGSTRSAKLICRDCPVATECLEHALANDERHGVWGGFSERERYRISRGEDVPFRIPGESKTRQAFNECQECGGSCEGRAKFCTDDCRTAAITRRRRNRYLSLKDTA
jgi:WhiB family redox-sensing transcriptional regulator